MSNILIHILLSLIIFNYNIQRIISISCNQSQTECNISCNKNNQCSTNIICPLSYNCQQCTINCNSVEYI